MTYSKKEIILIARNFPPLGGVGTRRWSKFAKYLAKRGYIIHVITIDYKYSDTVNWSHDVDHPNIVIHRLKNTYPDWLLRHRKRGFVAKKWFELVNLYYRSTSNWMDNAQGWEKVLIPYVRNLIRTKGINNVIVTAAPCSVAYMTSIIKVENPSINLIVDFRDKWNDEPQYAYGSAIKSFKKKEKAVYMEVQTMLMADKIVVTTQSVMERFSSIHKTCSDKYVVIHNGFDREEYLTENQTAHAESNNLRVVYFGSLLGKRAMGIDLLAEAISELDDPFFNTRFKVDIFGVAASGYLNPNRQVFNFKPFADPQQIGDVLSDYHCGLSILDPMQSDIFGTKVFDYMASDKAILNISGQGELYRLLEEKAQYVSDYNVNNLKSALVRLKNDFLNQQLRGACFDEFDIASHTTKLEKLFV